MDQNGIDASLGLALALELLKERQETGELRGTISMVHFLKEKQYWCVILLEHGRIISCSLFDKQGQRQRTDEVHLIKADENRGPFGWKFYPRAVVESSLPSPVNPALSAPQPTWLPAGISPMRDDAIPVRLEQELQISWLTTWNENEITFLRQIFSLINGQRSVHDIKALMFRSSPEMVEKSLVFLVAMKQISIQITRNR